MALKYFIVVHLIAAMLGGLFNPAAETEKIDIAFLPVYSQLEGTLFNEMVWDALTNRFEGRADTAYYYTADIVADLNTAIENGSELIWLTYIDITDEIAAIFTDNPDVTFIIIDYDYDQTFDNVLGVNFEIEEASYQAGILAAEMTESGRVGFIGGVDISPVNTFLDGYSRALDEMGVELVVEYIDSFTDPDKAYETASAMYADGVDIIFHAAGASGDGMIQAAVDTGNYAIGVDYDQSYLAPDNVITSVYKDLYKAAYALTELYLQDKLPTGETIILGLEGGYTGLSGYIITNEEIKTLD